MLKQRRCAKFSQLPFATKFKDLGLHNILSFKSEEGSSVNLHFSFLIETIPFSLCEINSHFALIFKYFVFSFFLIK